MEGPGKQAYALLVEGEQRQKVFDGFIFHHCRAEIIKDEPLIRFTDRHHSMGLPEAQVSHQHDSDIVFRHSRFDQRYILRDCIVLAIAASR